MFLTPWDYVRPRRWYSMASLEQSMMDLDHMATEMLSHFPMRDQLLAAPGVEDDEFFKDLPVAEKDTQVDPKAEKENKKSTRAYSNYSYSSSSILDDKGKRVESVRRRYEDSNGRLKAVHERRVGDKTYRQVWNRKNKEDTGTHETICSGQEDEFEKMWNDTALGKAAKKKELEEKKPEETQKKLK